MRGSTTGRSLLAGCLLACLLLAGCTKEKAAALHTAADAFRDQAALALDGYGELVVTSLLGAPVPQDEQVRQSVKQLTAISLARGAATPQEITEAFSWAEDAAVVQGHPLMGKLEQTRRLYVEFAAAYARLPQGSFVAAKEVACSAALGLRLVHRLAGMGADLAQNPQRLMRQRAAAQAALVRATSARDAEAIARAGSDMAGLLRAEKAANAAALGRLADAVEAGQVVVGLSRDFARVDVADILDGLARMIEVRQASFGLAPNEQLQKFAAVKARLEADSAVQAVLALPLGRDVPDCKPN